MVFQEIRMGLCLLLVAAVAAAPPPASAEISLELLWRHGSGASAGAEIVAYDALNQELLVINAAASCVARLDIRDGRELGRLDVAQYGSPTSVAVHRGLVAVAVVAHEPTKPGGIAFFETSDQPDTADNMPVGLVRVGALPDMVTFTGDGRYLLVANEGEPRTDYQVDPEGSISIVDVSRGPKQAFALTASFLAFNPERESLMARGVRIRGPSLSSADGLATVAQDVEPEYIAVSKDNRTAWVTLQENNAIAVVDIRSARVTDILPLGLKDHSRPGQGLDPSDLDAESEDRTSGIHIQTWPVFGMYQPDSLAAFEYRGTSYLITANEGDDRKYDAFKDSIRVAEARIDPALLHGKPRLKEDDQLGRLKISRVDGDTDGDGELDRLMAFGARSVAIWTADGKLVYDSGDALEQWMAEHLPERFNRDGLGPEAIDGRSGDKGPEPEGIVVGRVGSSTYAFVGLERIDAIAVFDVTFPRRTKLVDIVPLGPRTDEGEPTDLDLAPEGLAFIPADRSPWGEPLLAVACEASGSTLLFRVRSKR